MRCNFNPVNLSILTIPRLKAYRKSLYGKIGPYEQCWCGGTGCDYEMDYNRNSPRYIFLKNELTRVNIELAARQKKEYQMKLKKEWANISITSVEEQRKKRRKKLF